MSAYAEAMAFRRAERQRLWLLRRLWLTLTQPIDPSLAAFVAAILTAIGGVDDVTVVGIADNPPLVFVFGLMWRYCKQQLSEGTISRAGYWLRALLGVVGAGTMADDITGIGIADNEVAYACIGALFVLALLNKWWNKRKGLR